jgi:hypothetical protein
MDRLDDVRPREDQMIVAPLERLAAEILGRRVVQLDIRTHRAVEDQNPLIERAKIWSVRRGV